VNNGVRFEFIEGISSVEDTNRFLRNGISGTKSILCRLFIPTSTTALKINYKLIAVTRNNLINTTNGITDEINTIKL
jgi:hypothetical protein